MRLLGRSAGSRPYMAPEQYRSQAISVSVKDDYSKVDVFAVGVMLFEMLTGGLHPVGERTSLIWPVPAEGTRSAYRHDGPWKKWIKNGAPVADWATLPDGEMRRIVGTCLDVNAARRC